MAAEFGAVIGKETRDEGFNVSLGGGIDLARDPRGGRNFEYHGEDPILAGTIIAPELQAIQKQGVVATIKHYALNDQEAGGLRLLSPDLYVHETSGRWWVSSNLDARSMRETDLLAFEIGIKESGVGAVMCSYNRVNGVYACQNSYLLNDVLKNDWGFKGWVMSDWGATHSTVEAALSGLDQEFFASTYFAGALKEAVNSNLVPISRIDNMVHRILRSLFAVGVFDNPPVVKPIEAQADALVAQRVEEQGIVLLKNRPASPRSPSSGRTPMWAYSPAEAPRKLTQSEEMPFRPRLRLAPIRILPRSGILLHRLRRFGPTRRTLLSVTTLARTSRRPPGWLRRRM
jgi:beta-glucosidase